MAHKTRISTKRVLITSLITDIGDITVNSIVAIMSGSIVMLSEMLQGLADVVIDIMLLIGFSRSRRRSTRQHPFGFGKEMYFWAILAGVFILFITSSLAVYFGLRQIIFPEIIDRLYLAYIALSLDAATNIYAFSVSYRHLMSGSSWRDVWRVFRNSPRAATKTTFVADLMGSLAALLGLTALIIYGFTGNILLDGIGAVGIGLVLGALAVVLLIGLKGLVTGQSASPAIEMQIRELVTAHPAVLDVPDLKTMVIGSERLLVNIDVHLRDELETDQVEAIMDEIKAWIRQQVPEATDIQVEPETPSQELLSG